MSSAARLQIAFRSIIGLRKGVPMARIISSQPLTADELAAIERDNRHGFDLSGGAESDLGGLRPSTTSREAGSCQRVDANTATGPPAATGISLPSPATETSQDHPSTHSAQEIRQA